MLKFLKFGQQANKQLDSDTPEAIDQQLVAATTEAKNAFHEKRWPVVVQILEPLLDHPQTTPQMYVWTSFALREQANLDAAEALTTKGIERFPNDTKITIERADIAMKRQDWATAALRLEEITNKEATAKHGGAPEASYTRLAIAKTNLEDLEGAEKAITDGWLAHGRTERLDIESTQVSMKRCEWAEAVERLEWVLANYENIRPVIYMRLAVAHKSMGNFAQADKAIDHGRKISEDHEQLDTEWARIAISASKWTEAVRRYEWLIKNYDKPASDRYVKLAECHMYGGDFEGAEHAIETGWSKLGHQVDLDLTWAALATRNGDNAEAVGRCLELIERHGPKSTVTAYLDLAQAYCKRNDFAAAETTLSEATQLFPDDNSAELELAILAIQNSDWQKAADHFRAVTQRGQGAIATVYTRLVHAYRSSANGDMAKETCRIGVEQWPTNLPLLSLWAQEAMIDKDWSAALDRFETLITAHQERHFGPLLELPKRGLCLDWHEGHWCHLVDSLHEIANENGRSLSPHLFGALADVLARLGEHERAKKVLRLGLEAYPADPVLRFEHVLQVLETSKSGPGQPADDKIVREEIYEEISSVSSSVLGNELATLRKTFDSLMPQKRSAVDVKFRGFHIVRGTSLELLVKSERYFSPSTVDERIKLESETALWPEIPNGSPSLEAHAHEVARQYFERHKSKTDLTKSVLVETVFRLIYSELCVLEPARRLATSIAKDATEEPVFVEISGQPIEYLSSFTPTEIGQIYLYQELYRLGVNVFLCRFVPQLGEADEYQALEPLELRPSPLFLRSRGTTKEISDENTDVAIAPGGIRSVQSVIDQLGNPVVYATGYIVQDFAYDRTWFRPVKLAASFQPPRSLLPNFSYEFNLSESLTSTDLLTGDQTSETPLGISETIEGDWIDWLGEMVQPSLNELYRRCLEEVDLRGIKEVNVADNIYAESALFAAAVKSRGGNVTLWPHSANPIDLTPRQPGSFDRVNAVTKAGCASWAEQFPDVEVVHQPSLMLNPPVAQTLDPSKPLSVVILGGKNVLGLMPFAHQTQHEDAYRNFFDGLEELKKEHDLQTFFKPKGIRGENEAWLDRVVDQSAAWQTVAEHPLRLSLPNMLFVSLTVASSAIWEGLGRGVPGIVVTDALARDYTTIDGSSIPSGSCAEMLEIVRDCASPGGLEKLVAAEWPYYCAQTGYENPV